MRVRLRSTQKTHILFPPASVRFRSLGQQRKRPINVVVPTDLFVGAWRQLFPAERMMVFGGRSVKRLVRITSAADVTEPRPSQVHVRADTAKLVRSLLDFERTSAHFALWMHSHPGCGSAATYPSQIDLTQEEELRRHYSQNLVCAIAVADGCFRLWGQAIERGLVRVRWQGAGVTPVTGEPNVYRLQVD